ncbi:MAG TPA: hypothetical protein VH650_05595 [Gaiellaceae bacterium]|jgi:hypothetical protein
MDARDDIDQQALARSEGFGVYGISARVGIVEKVRLERASGRPVLLSVRAGLLGSWLVHVPVDQVADVVPEERRVVLRPGGLLAGPRSAAVDTRAA